MPVFWTFLLLVPILPRFLSSPVIVGNVRVSVLSERLVRLEHSTKGAWEDRGSLTFPTRVIRASASVERYATGGASISTSQLRVDVGAVDVDGYFSCALLNVTVFASGVTWCPDVLGLFDAASNLNGSVSTTDCYAASPDACIKAYESRMFPGILSRAGWHVIDDTSTALLDDSGWVTARPADNAEVGYADWVFVASADSFTATLSDYVTSGAGEIPVLPVRAYSTWFSRYYAFNAPTLSSTLSVFANRSMPINMLVMDMDWHKVGAATLGCGPTEPVALAQCGEGFGGYAFNQSLFPSPASFLATVKQIYGVQIMANIHSQCGVDHCQPNYTAFAKALGIDPATKAPVPCAFSDARYVEGLYKFELDEEPVAGFDYFWEDMGLNGVGAKLGCSGELHCQTCLGDLHMGASPGGDHAAALWTAHVRVTRREQATGLRGMTLGIFGGLGHHRYGVVGSGDTQEAWKTLRYEAYLTITAANVLVAWTHDLGAFYPPSGPDDGGDWTHDPLLYLRWLQWGSLSPFFRPHASHGEVVPWAYPESFSAYMEPLWRLRSSLLPYLYTAAHAAAISGVLPCHGLYLDWANESAAYAAADYAGGACLQHTFGPDFIVTPVDSPSASALIVWVPPGQWLACQTRGQTLLSGPSFATLQLLSIGEQPTLCRQFAVVPGRLWDEAAGNVIGASLILTVFWGGGALPTAPVNHSTVVIEDDGASVRSSQRVIAVGMSIDPATRTSRVDIVPSTAPGLLPAQRSYSLRWRGVPASVRVAAARVEGQSVSWSQKDTSGGNLGEEDAWAHAAGAGVDGWRLNVVTVDVALTGADTAVSVEIDWS